MTTTSTEPSYELCYDPRDQDMLIYRSIPAGICGPFSNHVPCKSREQAERIAFGMGYLINGAWETHTNYDSAELTRMS